MLSSKQSRSSTLSPIHRTRFVPTPWSALHHPSFNQSGKLRAPNPITRPHRLVGGHLNLWWDGGVQAFMDLCIYKRILDRRWYHPVVPCCRIDDKNNPIFLSHISSFPRPCMHLIGSSCKSHRRQTSCLTSKERCSTTPVVVDRYGSIGACSALACAVQPRATRPKPSVPEQPPFEVDAMLAHARLIPSRARVLGNPTFLTALPCNLPSAPATDCPDSGGMFLLAADALWHRCRYLVSVGNPSEMLDKSRPGKAFAS